MQVLIDYSQHTDNSVFELERMSPSHVLMIANIYNIRNTGAFMIMHYTIIALFRLMAIIHRGK